MDATTLPVLASTTTDVLLQPEKMRFDALSYAMPVGPSHGASGHEAVAFHVLTSITWIVFLPSLLTKMCPLPSAAAPSGAVSSSSTVATMSPVLRIDRGQRADRAAVIRQDDLVVGLVVHDAVETGAHLDLLEHGQRLQIEHGDGLVAAVRREAVTGLGGDAGAVHARRVRNVAEHFAGGAFDHHHVGARATRTRGPWRLRRRRSRCRRRL